MTSPVVIGVGVAAATVVTGGVVVAIGRLIGMDAAHLFRILLAVVTFYALLGVVLLVMLLI